MVIDANQLESLRSSNEHTTIALRFGTYDILHAGHQVGINFAASQADLLVVGVMPDSWVEKRKGVGRPLNPQLERAQTIAKAPDVDFSFIAPETTLSLVGVFRRLRPNVYVEHKEHTIRYLKAGLLRILGIDYVVDHSDRLYSSTSMIADLGLSDALASSSLLYMPNQRKNRGII